MACACSRTWVAAVAALAILVLPACNRSPSPKSQAAAGRRPPARVQFTDVTQAAGIHFTHFNGATGNRYIVETMGSGGAFLDFDGDGWLDILILNGKPLAPEPPTPNNRHPMSTSALYRNNHDGTFTDVTKGSGLDVPLYAMGCCAGDYDNDGDVDLYITCALAPGHLFRNEGGGRFADVTRLAGGDDHGKLGTSCAWLDYDNDGWLDLFVCNYVQYSIATDHPCYEGGRRFYCRPLVYRPDTCVLYHNRGDGTFSDVTKESGIFNRTGNSLGVAVWDFDDDGYPDIVIANDLTPNYLFHNIPASDPRSPGRRFEEVGLDWGVAFGEDGKARAGMGIDVAEYRNDARPAILISNFTGEPLSFFVGDAQHQFTDLSFTAGLGESHLRFLGFGLFFFDYDNDGLRDAFVGNGHIEPNIASFGGEISYGQRNQVYHNRGDGTFEEIAQSLGPPFGQARVTRGAGTGDFDNDGDPDILVMNNGQPAELLRNDGGNGKNWLQIELHGQGPGAKLPTVAGAVDMRRGSNRDGIGARVTVRSGGGTQRDAVRSGSSYCSQSMLRLHFGLGSAATAEEVEVRWPGGTVDRLQNVQANQRIVVVEGEGMRSP